MHDKERSGLEARARMSDGRVPHRLSAIMGALGAAATTFALAGPAQASVEYYSQVTFKYGDGSFAKYGGIAGLTVPQHYALNGTGGAAYADANDAKGGTASVDLAIIGQGLVPASQLITDISAVSTVTYRFSLSGPTNGGTVPVLLSGAGASTGGWDFLSIQDGFGSGFFQQGNFDVKQVLNLVPGWGYTMVLYTDAAVYSNGLATGDIREEGATVDPTLTIQGDLAKDYHFVGLPASTIGGIAAVPEPASWAMMVGGFGLVGSAIRRRRTRVCFA